MYQPPDYKVRKGFPAVLKTGGKSMDVLWIKNGLVGLRWWDGRSFQTAIHPADSLKRSTNDSTHGEDWPPFDE